MKTFEELIEEGEGIDICISGHCMESGMSAEDALAYFRADGVDEENIHEDRNFDRLRILKGNVSFYLTETLKRQDQAEEIGVFGLKTHIEIIPGNVSNSRLEKDSVTQAKKEFLELLIYHVGTNIPGTSYYPYRRVFQAVNKPI